MKCPFIEAVESNDIESVEHMTADCDRLTTGRLVSWAQDINNGMTMVEILTEAAR